MQMLKNISPSWPCGIWLSNSWAIWRTKTWLRYTLALDVKADSSLRNLWIVLCLLFKFGIHNTYIRQKILVMAAEYVEGQGHLAQKMADLEGGEGGLPSAPPIGAEPSAPSKGALEQDVNGGDPEGAAKPSAPQAEPMVVDTFKSTECVICLENKARKRYSRTERKRTEMTKYIYTFLVQYHLPSLWPCVLLWKMPIWGYDLSVVPQDHSTEDQACIRK